MCIRDSFWIGKCIHVFSLHFNFVSLQTGGCVGELNHRTFWLLLFFQTWALYWMFSISLSGLSIYSDDNVELQKKATHGKSNEDSGYSSEYGAFLVTAFLSFVFFVFAGGLLLYHTFLVLTNQTTWEHNRSSSLDYVKCYPRGYLPFSKGVVENFKTIFLHKSKVRDWKLPPLKAAKESKHFNIWENKYWSCC
eukprot:TRINITY_DN12744_c0_g1_i2.p1 TRINITY_DN12744_c0_g1~~TRINITY_DN12744_c0_g1_i2.p1  ORF type:complete len:213 (-),score=49.08 TRINITY_DN12744_c0_g1_i2:114-692(-)